MTAVYPVQTHKVANGRAWPAGEGLTIAVIAAVGEGRTELSAFDAALFRCGIHNYNLIRLSSVIPPAAQVLVSDRYDAPPTDYGHKLYAVKADVRCDEPGTAIAAGLGWLQTADGRGLFVEHGLKARHLTRSEIERNTAEQIVASLTDLAEARNVPFTLDQIQMHIVSTRVESRPACALTVAVYEAEGWGQDPSAGQGSRR